ncbi:MAG: hypothetical protein GTO24_22775 [candidate division Zixibacteria bacterium]|nr:hypothetical protein [candidate division Zixibacteria bacterium]
MVKRLSWILLILLVLTSLECGTERRKFIPPELRDKIIFLCSEGICTINADGTDREVIIPSEGKSRFSNPRWSPTKSEIAFTAYIKLEGWRGRGDYAKVLVAASDGTRVDTLGLIDKRKSKIHKKKASVLRAEGWEHDVSFHSWSPDGKYLLYVPGGMLDVSAIAVMDRTGKVITQLGGAYASFGGRNEIVYVGFHDSIVQTSSDIYVYDLEKKEKRRVTNETQQMYLLPVFSPDGKMIAFQHYGPTGNGSWSNELWIMRSDGSEKKILAEKGKDYEGGALRFLAFLPDGDKLVFIPDAGDTSQIYVVNTDGSGVRTLTEKVIRTTGEAGWSPASLSPDGREVVFTSAKDGDDELYIADINGNGLKKLTNNSVIDCCPNW